MQQVIYKPVHGSSETVQSAGVELTPGVPVTVTDEQAELLLRSQYIVDASTGQNPNFVCTVCGKDTNEDAVFDHVRARLGGSPLVSLVDEDGKRRCSTCPRGTITVSAPVVPDPFVDWAEDKE